MSLISSGDDDTLWVGEIWPWSFSVPGMGGCGDQEGFPHGKNWKCALWWGKSSLIKTGLMGSCIADDAHHPCGILFWDSFWRRWETGTLMEFASLFYQVEQILGTFKLNPYQRQAKKIRTILCLNRGSAALSSASITGSNPHTLHSHNKPCLLLWPNSHQKKKSTVFPKSLHTTEDHLQEWLVVILCVWIYVFRGR